MAALFDESVHEYVIVYVPVVDVSTDALLSVMVGELSNVSVHVAPASVYVVSFTTLTVALPVSVIVGMVVSLTLTVLITCTASLFDESVQSYVTS